MNETMEFKNLRRVALNELRKLDSMYADKQEFSEADAKKYDCMMHGLKCQLTAEAMMEAEEPEMEGMSGRRGRSSVTGRYVSRDGGQSYAEGYSHGYNEAMSQRSGNNQSYADGYNRGYSEANMRTSGHYPIYPPDRMHY